MPTPSFVSSATIRCGLIPGLTLISVCLAVYLLLSGALPGLSAAADADLPVARAEGFLEGGADTLAVPVRSEWPQLAVAAETSGTMRYVAATGGNNIGDCTNPTSPCATIHYALGQVAAGDTISLTAGYFQITPTLTLTTSVTIRGSGKTSTNLFGLESTTLAVSQGVTASVENLSILGSWRTLTCVSNSGTLSLSNAQIAGCKKQSAGQGTGTGIYNTGVLTVTDSMVTNNGCVINATPPCEGGGIWSSGSVTLIRSELYLNGITGNGGRGGAIFNSEGTLLLDGATLRGNIAFGGAAGIYVEGGTLTVTNGTQFFMTYNAPSIGNSGAIYNDGGTVSVDAAYFEGLAGGIVIDNVSGSMTINNSHFFLDYKDVKSSGSLTVTNTLFEGSGVIGIESTGTAYLTGNTFRATSGKGVWIRSPMTTFFDNTFSGNRGEGLVAESTFTVTNITSTGGGGNAAVVVGSGGNLTVISSTISGNSSTSSGAGIRVYDNGSATIISTTVSNNTAATFGGGATVSNTGSLRFIASSVISNTAGTYGGGIANAGVLTLANSTVASNKSNDDDTKVDRGGGGIYNTGTTAVDFSTIANNSAPNVTGNGGSLYNSGSATFRSSIVANGNPADCQGTITDGDYNLFGDYTCGPRAAHSRAEYPVLGALTGSPAYLPLGDGSPAIEVVPLGVNGCGTTQVGDIRGLPRPGGYKCDLGAYEVNLLHATVTPTVNVPYHGVVTYTTTVQNLTSITDTTASLYDTLPSQIEFGGWIDRPGGAEFVDNYDGTYNVNWRGVLLPSTSVTLVFTATHIGDINEVVTNTFEYQGKQASSYSVPAVFAVEPAATLTVVKAGNPDGGFVTSDPPDLIDCGVTCTTAVRPGTPVTLTASAYVTGTFYGWNGNVCAGTGVGCVLPVDEATTVTATFKVKTAMAVTNLSPTVALVGQAVTAYYDANTPGTRTPAGNVTVGLSDGVSSCQSPVTSGTCVFRPLGAGDFTLTASYGGDSAFESSAYTSTYKVEPASTNLSLETFPPRTVAGQGVDIDYRLSVAPPGGGLFTGTVTIADSLGNARQVVAPTDTVTRTVTITPALAGTLVITSSFPGNANYLASSTVVTHEVGKADTTVRITADTPDYSRLGEGVAVRFTLAAQSPGSGTPTGQVRVGIRNDTASCTATVPEGGCVLTPTRRLNTILVAAYRGDDNYNPSSTAEPHMVGNPNAPLTRVTIDADLPGPSVVGQAVVVSYTSEVVNSTNTVLPGEVVVIASDGTYCSGPVAGACSLQLNSAGTVTLTALYSGDDDYQGAVTAKAHVVNPANTVTRFRSAAPEPSVLGNPVLVYYTVDARAPGSGTPPGVVTVRDSDGNACSGVAPIGRCRLTPQAPGYKTVTAAYSATASFNGSQGSGTHEVMDIPIQDLTIDGTTPAMITRPAYFTATVRAGTNVVYRWDFGDSTLPVTSTAGIVSHTYSLVGSYTVTVSASNWGSSAESQMTIATVDVPVSGLQAAHSGTALLGGTVWYTATVAAGTNVLYLWDFGDGSPRASGRTVRHVYARTGTLTPRVFASNGSSGAQVDAPTVQVVTMIAGLSAGNNSPVRWGQSMLFTSTVRSGLQVRYQWNWGNGAPVYETTRRTARYTYPIGGSYTAIVTATNDASSQVLTMPVTVIDDSILGLSAVSSTPTRADQMTYFTATVQQGTSVVYTWDFGDGRPTATGANVQHKYDPPPGTSETQVYTATVTARNPGSSAVDTSEVSIYFTPPETRDVGSMRVTGGRWRDMGGGAWRVLDMLSFADGKVRLTGPEAVIYYTRSSFYFTGTVELRSDNRSLKIGTGPFTASLSKGQASANGPLSNQFSQVSGFDVTGTSFTVDLVNALVMGSATQMSVAAPSQTFASAVTRFTVSVQGTDIRTTGTLEGTDLTLAGMTTHISSFALENVGVSTPIVRLTLPAALGGRGVTGRNLRLAPNAVSMDEITLTLTGAAGTIGPAIARLETTPSGQILAYEGTLRVALPQNRTSVPVEGIIGADGKFSGSFETVELGLSGSKLTLINAELDSLDRLQAPKGILQMNENMGGGSGSYGDVTINPTEVLLDGSDDIAFPEIRLAQGTSEVTSATGGFVVDGKGWGLALDGTYVPNVRLNRPAAIHIDTGPTGRLSGEVTDLSIYMSVADIEAKKAIVRPNGTVYTESADITLFRIGASEAKATIYSVVIGPRGLKLGGGGVELPDIKRGGFTLASLGGRFYQRDENTWVIGFQGGFSAGALPAQTGDGGKPPSEGPSCNGVWVGGIIAATSSNGLAITFMPVREAPIGAQSLSVSIEQAKLRVFCDIPLGNGWKISEIRGEIRMDDKTSRISIGFTFSTEEEFYTYPMASIEADAYLQWSPYWEVGLEGTLKFLFWELLKASVTVGEHKAQIRVEFNLFIVDGELNAVIWKDAGSTNFAGWAYVNFRIKKGVVFDSWLLSIPPWDFTLGNAKVEVGRFKPRYVWGVKGQLTVWGWEVGAFIDVDGEFSVTNVDSYELVRPKDMLGYSVAANGLMVAPAVDDTRDATFGVANTAIFALAGTGALPALTILDPQNNAITGSPLPANVDVFRWTRYRLPGSAETLDGRVRARFVHAAPGAGPVDVTFGDASLLPNQSAGTIAEYQTVSTTLPVRIVPAGGGAPIVHRTLTLTNTADATIALVPSGGSVDLVVLADTNWPLPKDGSLVRLVNLGTPGSELNLNHQAGLKLAGPVSYTIASRYSEVDAGTGGFKVRDSASRVVTGVITTTATEARHVYSLFVLPPPDGQTAPRVVLQRDTPGQARLRLANFGPGRSPLDLWVTRLADGIPVEGMVASNVAHTQTSNYASVDSSALSFRLTPAGVSGATVVTGPLALEHGDDYTLVAAPSGAEVQPLVLTDDNSLPESGITRLRLANLAGPASPISLQADRNAVFENVGSNASSGYREISGTVSLLEFFDFQGVGQLALPVSLRDGQSYTVFAYELNPPGDLGATVATDLATEKISQLIYTVHKPQPGRWRSTMSGGSGLYDFAVLGTAASPSVNDLAVNQSPDGRQAQVSWKLATPLADSVIAIYANSDPITSTQIVTAASGITSTEVATRYVGTALASDLTLTGIGWITDTALITRDVDLSRLPSGTYHIWLGVEDSRNMPLRQYASQTVTVEPRPWSTVWSSAVVTATAHYRRVELAWQPHPDPDVVGYNVGVSGPTITGTSVYTLGLLSRMGFGALDPNAPYNFTVAAVRSDGQVAWSGPVVMAAKGAPLGLAVSGPSTFNLTNGQAAVATLLLATTSAVYPELVGLREGDVPPGLDIDLPLDALSLTGAGLAVTVPFTASEYLEAGRYVVPITAYGVGYLTTVSLTLTVGPVAPASVLVSGPTTVQANASQAFTATVSTLSTTVPLTYTWQATDHSPATRAGGLDEITTFAWAEAGEKTVTVTVGNDAGSVSSTWKVAVLASPVTSQTLQLFVDGGGGVYVEPVGVTCTGSCTWLLGTGTAITLTAIEGANHKLSGWGGDFSGTSRVVSFTLTGDRRVDALFQQIWRIFLPSVIRSAPGG